MRSICDYCLTKYAFLEYLAYKSKKFSEFFGYLVNSYYFCAIITIANNTMRKPTIDSKCWAAFLEMGARLENSPSKL